MHQEIFTRSYFSFLKSIVFIRYRTERAWQQANNEQCRSLFEFVSFSFLRFLSLLLLLIPDVVGWCVIQPGPGRLLPSPRQYCKGDPNSNFNILHQSLWPTKLVLGAKNVCEKIFSNISPLFIDKYYSVNSQHFEF